MLTLEHDKETGAPKLYIRNPFAVAWIGHYRRLTVGLRSEFTHVKDIHDWRMWVKLRPELPPFKGKSPTGLLIESSLRSWLLRRFHVKLRDMNFDDLCAIAQGKQPLPRQRLRRTYGT
jgi:hypothetical protein